LPGTEAEAGETDSAVTPATDESARVREGAGRSRSPGSEARLMDLDLIFCDDSRQRHPSRDGMGSLVALGGIQVPGENVGQVERELQASCETAGFPPGESFKWSPGTDMWMKRNLVDDVRQAFFLHVIDILKRGKAKVFVIIEDETRRPTRPNITHELDVATLLLERVSTCCTGRNREGLVVAAQPSGGHRSEGAFLQHCLEQIEATTNYIVQDHIAMNVVSTPAKLVRLLQAADIVVSSSVARVAGEYTYSPAVFTALLPLFEKAQDRIGGVGLKLHPDFRYVNLYHWLLGDSHVVKANMGVPLPLMRRPYAAAADVC